MIKRTLLWRILWMMHSVIGTSASHRQVVSGIMLVHVAIARNFGIRISVVIIVNLCALVDGGR